MVIASVATTLARGYPPPRYSTMWVESTIGILYSQLLATDPIALDETVEAILARPPVISSRAPVIAPGPVVAARTVISARGPTPHTVRSRPPAGALSPGPLWATSSVWASALTAALGAIVAGIVGWTHRGSP